MAQQCEISDGTFFDPASSREFRGAHSSEVLYRTFAGAYVLVRDTKPPVRLTNLEACRWLLQTLQRTDEIPDDLKPLAAALIV